RFCCDHVHANTTNVAYCLNNATLLVRFGIHFAYYVGFEFSTQQQNVCRRTASLEHSFVFMSYTNSEK
ncbi:unnamed protein product, partial [Ceratitis capitata]